MLERTLKNHHHVNRTHGFYVTATRFAATLMLVCALPVAAAAYTIILRSSRRVEIPAAFTVTRTTLTYEAAPSIYVTLPMAHINIAATERINGEPYGSLLRRVEPQAPPRANAAAVAASPTTRPRRARHTLTNQDLEASRRARRKSEEAYERRRIELGLPSAESTRRSAEEETHFMREFNRRQEEKSSQQEAYWRGRATQLRTATAVLDAEIDYLRARLAETSAPAPGYTTVTEFDPFFTGQPYPPYPTGPNVGHIGSVYPFNYGTSDRAVLRDRLQTREAERAGMEARWRLLEEEARRAGALPGWLRP